MAQRVVLWICRRVAAFGSLILSLYGVYCWIATGLRHDWYVVTLYCALPILSFPVFLLSKWRPRLGITLHWALAFGYLAVFSMLEWRTCAELQYCISVADTVFKTLRTIPVETAFAVGIANLLAYRLSRRTANAATQRPLR